MNESCLSSKKEQSSPSRARHTYDGITHMTIIAQVPPLEQAHVDAQHEPLQTLNSKLAWP